MTKSTIRSNLTSFNPDIAATKAQGLDYILGETNSYSCHGAPGLSNTAGVALWALDYALYASQIGVTRVHFQNGIGFKFNFVRHSPLLSLSTANRVPIQIQPVTLARSILDGSPLSQPLAPHVQPAYYAAIIVAEAIGNTGSARAVELSIDDTHVAGYAFYEGRKLVRAVLINSQAYLANNATGCRGTIHVNIQLDNSTGVAPFVMTIKRLAIGCVLIFCWACLRKTLLILALCSYADDTSGLTWGGQSYETPDALVRGVKTTDIAPINAGVDLHDTEAVLLNFDIDIPTRHRRRNHLNAI